MVKSCYIHIPFCDSICSYCDFCKMIYHKKIVNDYLKSLEEEIRREYRNEELETIYIGGGTPSCLDLDDLERLFSIIDSLKRTNNCEFTVEGNFHSTTKEKLELYQKHHVNRVSLGIESIDQDNLCFLERDESQSEIVSKIKLIKEMGFHNINVDLIYAIPNESMDVLKRDLDFILSLDVPHISTYSLIIEDHTKLKMKNVCNISDDLDYQMYSFIADYLKKHGYSHYEISNYSKDGFFSQHNLCYWLNHEYYGFGLGASSYIDGVRKTNSRSLKSYSNGLVLEKEILSIDDQIEYEVILNLRLKRGIDFYDFKEKYGVSFPELFDYDVLVKDGFLSFINQCLFIPEDKYYVSNEIIVKLLQNKKELC